MIIARGPGYIRVRVGRRTVTLAGDTEPDGPTGPDFVVFLDAIERWDAPDAGEALSLDDVRRITETVEHAGEQSNLDIAFE